MLCRPIKQREPCTCHVEYDRQIKFPPKPWLTKLLNCFTNLREVYLRLEDSVGAATDYERLHFITEFPCLLKGCKALKRLSVEIPMMTWMLGDEQDRGHMKGAEHRSKILQGMMIRLNDRLGVQGEQIKDVNEGLKNHAQVWE